MDKCFFCECETELYSNGVPMCEKCEPDLSQMKPLTDRKKLILEPRSAGE